MSGAQYSSWNLLVREAAEQFRQAGIDPADAENEARQIFSFVTGKDRTWLFLHGDEKVLYEDGKAPDGVQRFLNLARERAKRIPLAYVLGERDFFGRTFLVTPDVLIPEPETELLVEQVLQERSSRKNARNTSTSVTEKLMSNEFAKVFQKEKAPAAQKSLRILDLCTGSGCIAVTLAAELAAEALTKLPAFEVVAADISEAALRVAAENAKKILGSDADLVRFVRSDLFAEIEGSFEIIVSNPPYSIKWAGSDNPLLINDPRFSPAGVLAPKGKADLAFIMHSLSWLATSGTAAIVCFPGIMYRGGAEQKIRKYLIDNNYVDCVIQLPSNLFFGTSIATCIMVLKKSKSENKTLFIDATSECVKVTNNNKLTPENIDRIVNVFVKREEVEHFAHLASYEEVSGNDYNLSVATYVEAEDTREKIDIVKLNAEIKEIVAREQVLRDEIDKIIAEIEVGV